MTAAATGHRQSQRLRLSILDGCICNDGNYSAAPARASSSTARHQCSTADEGRCHPAAQRELQHLQHLASDFSISDVPLAPKGPPSSLATMRFVPVRCRVSISNRAAYIGNSSVASASETALRACATAGQASASETCRLYQRGNLQRQRCTTRACRAILSLSEHLSQQLQLQPDSA